MNNHKGKLAFLWHAQAGECFYCGRSTWLPGSEASTAATARLSEPSKKNLRKRQASLEHLQRKTDGGSNGFDNLIMSCAGCNVGRLDKASLLHLADMRARHAPNNGGARP